MGPKEVPEESVPKRSSRRDLNECSVGGSDVFAVHIGDANTGASGNGSRRHPRG